MSQSLVKIIIHSIFSTKNRRPLIPAELRGRFGEYMAGTLNAMSCPAILVGCHADHAHCLNLLSKTMSVADMIEELKRSSSKWAKEQGLPRFYWQSGYGVFSVSESNVSPVRALMPT